MSNRQMFINVMITGEQTGKLSMKMANSVMGQQYDNETSYFSFTRPTWANDLILEVAFDTNEISLGRYKLGQDNILPITQALSQYLVLRMQVFFTENEIDLAFTNLVQINFRESLMPEEFNPIPPVGIDGHSPYIGENGNWYVWNDIEKQMQDTGIKAEGEDGIDGMDGHSPYIGTNGNWWEWSDEEEQFVDTGISAASDVPGQISTHNTDPDAHPSLLEALDAETQSRVNADDALSEDIAAEVQSRKNAEVGLQIQIDNKADKSDTYTKAEVDSAILEEQTARLATDSNLQTQIDTDQQYLKDLNTNTYIRKWYGNQAEYDAFDTSKVGIEFNIVEG